ncbi:riboflavin kinase [Candidatus Acidianus copahuensis]|uniref:Riboflavin kinase n=1 Tax=Candidatus Acidianus copahuensis TaxID=1160895 RepID=A0A031LPX4_9CREN|nr:riboflavin kinase [Candidatus Acidianus copahuensis]
MCEICILSKIITIMRKNGEITQQLLAKELEMSQQSVSRKLKELEDKKLISRTISKEGEIIRLTDEGEIYLNSCLETIREAISFQHNIRILGKVTSGLGEGRIFLGMQYYMDSFKKFLGFSPYPGTLNVVIYDKISFENRLFLESGKSIMIPEHREENKVLGAVKAYPASINNVAPAAIVIPLRSIHPKSVIEIVSPYYIREKLGLKDGDEVEINAMN